MKYWRLGEKGVCSESRANQVPTFHSTMSGESQQNDSIEFEQGDVVTDSEQVKEVIVVDVTDQRCDEYVVQPMPPAEADWCVDHYNDEYPKDDRVVEAVYVESCIWEPGDEFQRVVEAGEIDDNSIYGFPSSRLEKRG